VIFCYICYDNYFLQTFISSYSIIIHTKPIILGSEMVMKKKIPGMFVCILLITTAVPAVASLKNSMINSTILSFPLTSTTAWIEVQKLLASDHAEDFFGCSVSLSGDTVLIGNGNPDESGYAYVFTHTGTNWTQQQKLLASDGTLGSYFGCSVSLSGDTALIGAQLDDDNGENSGSAYVFTRTGTTWTQQAKLLASDGAAGDYFGCSVSLSGNAALIGAPADDDNGENSGSAYVFTRTGTTWSQQGKLLAHDAALGDYFGYFVSIDSDTSLIGALDDDDNGAQSGSAYVFTRTGNTWTQQRKLLASDGAAGDYFGCAVSLDDDTALIGADLDDDNGPYSGSAYVFTRIGTTWTQQAKLLASDGAAGDSFGWSVSLSSDTALIGAHLEDGDNKYDSGSAYVFNRTGTTWTHQAKLLASDGAEVDNFGYSVSLDDNTAIIGAYLDDDNGDYSGSAYVFTKVSNIPPVFGIPTPANRSIDNPLNIIWNISINDTEGDAFSWTIQCSNGQTNSGTGASNGTKSLTISGLAYTTTYKVWVNATDPNGSGLYTRKWYTFTTQQQPNVPPNKPNKPSGTTSGKIKVVYTYTTSTTDTNGDQVYYMWDWGDGTQSNWLGPYNSGITINTTHKWTTKGSYSIKVKATDINGAESSLSDPLPITMPYTYKPPLIQFFELLFQRFPHVFPIIRHLLGY
jgi:hypothetical protein